MSNRYLIFHVEPLGSGFVILVANCVSITSNCAQSVSIKTYDDMFRSVPSPRSQAGSNGSVRSGELTYGSEKTEEMHTSSLNKKELLLARIANTYGRATARLVACNIVIDVTSKLFGSNPSDVVNELLRMKRDQVARVKHDLAAIRSGDSAWNTSIVTTTTSKIIDLEKTTVHSEMTRLRNDFKNNQRWKHLCDSWQRNFLKDVNKSLIKIQLESWRSQSSVREVEVSSQKARLKRSFHRPSFSFLDMVVAKLRKSGYFRMNTNRIKVE